MESCGNVKCYCYHYLVARASGDILITVTRKKIKLNGFLCSRVWDLGCLIRVREEAYCEVPVGRLSQ